MAGRHAERGAALIELAILLPVLLLLGLATIEFALALRAYTTLVSQAETAARLLSTRTPGDGHDAARCLAATGLMSSLPCTGTPVLPGLSASLVSVADGSTAAATHRAQMTSASTGGVAVNLVTVTITGYAHPLTIGSVFNGLTGTETSLAFDPISVTMRQQL